MSGRTVTSITASNAEGLVLTANWKPNKYTVIFNANMPNAEGRVENIVANYDVEFNMPVCAYTAKGRRFKEWNTMSDGSGTGYSEDAVVKNLSSAPNANVTLYAIWEGETYKISFDAGEDIVKPVDMSIAFGDTIGSLPEVAKPGYEFSGWYTLSKGGTKVSVGDTYNYDKSITLYASWTVIKYTVTFNANGGEFTELAGDIVLDVDHGKKIDWSLIPTPSKTGASFDGWSLDQEGTSAFALDTSVTAAIVLYAKWADEKCEAPLANYESGETLNENTEIELYSLTEGAKIYYTLDGSAPTVASTLYERPIILTNDLIIKAIAVKEGITNSAVSAFNYEVSLDQGEVLDKDLMLLEGVTKNDQIRNIPEKLWVSAVDDAVYNGKTQTPQFRVYYGKKKLKSGTDYTFANSNKKVKFVNAGEYTVIVTGKGNYKDKVEITYEIEPRDVTNELEALLDYSVVENKKKGVKPVFNIYADGRKLVADSIKNGNVVEKDYSLSWTNYEGEENEACYVISSDEGSMTFETEVLITAHGNYTGSAVKNFAVKPSASINIAGTRVKITMPEIAAAKNVMTYENALNSLGRLEAKPVVEVVDTKKIDNKVLEEGEDYSVKYINNTALGTASVIISGLGDYYGSVTKKFTIKGVALSNYKVDFAYYVKDEEIAEGKRIDTASNVYNGVAQKPVFRIVNKKNKNDVLTLNKDYTITSYSNNINKGKGKVIVAGKDKYYGNLTGTFTITPVAVASERGVLVSEDENTLTYSNGFIRVTYDKTTPYTKQGGKPNIKVFFKDYYAREILLKEKTDYTVVYTNNKKINDANTFFSLSFKGNFAGKFSTSETNKFRGCYYSVEKQSISNMKISAADKAGNKKKNGYKVSPVITDPNANNAKLAAGTDYEKSLKYFRYVDGSWQEIENNTVINPTVDEGPVTIKVVATGKNNYFIEEAANTIETTYRVFPAVNLISSSKYVANAIPTQIYTGKEVEISLDDIEFTSKDPNLEPPTTSDFEIVSYKNNIKKGTATVTIRGIGDFGGSRTPKFKIDQLPINDAVIKVKPSATNDGLPIQRMAY